MESLSCCLELIPVRLNPRLGFGVIYFCVSPHPGPLECACIVCKIVQFILSQYNGNFLTVRNTAISRRAVVHMLNMFINLFKQGNCPFFYTLYFYPGAGIAQSVQRLSTGWTVRGYNPHGSRVSAPVQTGSEAHPASYTMGTGSPSGEKRPGLGVDHPAPSSAEIKKKGTSIHLLILWAFVVCSGVNFTFCL
jgi:hypothetical protein